MTRAANDVFWSMTRNVPVAGSFAASQRSPNLLLAYRG